MVDIQKKLSSWHPNLKYQYHHFQIVECFPNTMPKDLPDKIQKVKWTKNAKEVETWEHW